MKSALCETGRVPGRVDRNIKAGTAVYFPGGGQTAGERSVRIDEQDMKDILAAAPKSQRGWIRTRLGYMVVL